MTCLFERALPPPRASRDVGARGIEGDPDEPGLQPLLSVDPVQGAIGAHQGLLGHVLGVRAVPGDRPRNAQDESPVASDERVERARIPPASPLDEVSLRRFFLAQPGFVRKWGRDYTVSPVGCLEANAKGLLMFRRPTSAALAILALLPLLANCTSEPTRPSVVVITVDTLRADALGVFAQSDMALPTPHMDQFARSGALFEATYAPVPRTTQAVASLISGLHPLAHGADGLGMTLPAEVTTLAEAFAAGGYETAGFVTNFNLSPGRGFEQGFDIYSNPTQRWHGNSAASLTDEALAWLESREAQERPFFLWVHYLDPHWTYEPPARLAREADPGYEPPFDLVDEWQAGRFTKGQVIFESDEIMDERMIEHVRRLYQAEAHATDVAIGTLLEGLEGLHPSEEIVMGFTVDHGEALGDHDYWFAHGEYLYDDTLRVPMAFRAQGRIPPGTRVAGTSRLEDFAPTLLGLAGLPPLEGAEGLDLSKLLVAGGRHELAERPLLHLGDFLLIHDENPRQRVEGRAGRWLAYREEGFKLIRVPQPDGSFEEELYDLVADPTESVDLASREPERVEAMRRSLAALIESYENAPEGEVDGPDADSLDALRSLGYVD